MHHKVSPPKERPQPEAPETPEEPSLAAVPITPVEQPAGLANAKTEGKAELLAAMPVEIRRSVANATGQSEADWEAPSVGETPAAPAAAAAPAPAVPIQVTDGSEQQPIPAAAPVQNAQPAPAPAAEQPLDNAPLLEIKTKKSRSSDAIVFIIMMILFLGLGTVVAMLFISGTIAL
jgi:hypothetical protein